MAVAHRRVHIALQWGRDRAVAELSVKDWAPGPEPLSFNGAATARSRNCPRQCCASLIDESLQWGRDRAVAELRRVFQSSPLPDPPSMGPRPRGRGIEMLIGDAFNSQAGLQWGRDRAVAELVTFTPTRVTKQPSMGPRPRGRGILVKRADKECQLHLQWGRDRAVAELYRSSIQADPDDTPSMGPRPRGRGI